MMDVQQRSISLHNYGRAKEIADMLVEELGIPRSSTWFEVRFAIDEAVSVKCEFYAPIKQEPTDPLERVKIHVDKAHKKHLQEMKSSWVTKGGA